MRLLYICYMNLGISGSIGILKKIKSQISQFKENGIDVDFLYLQDRKVILDQSKGETACCHNNCIDDVAESLAENGYDFAYIRLNSYISFRLVSTIKHFKKSKTAVLFEIPTYPFTGELLYHIRESLHDFHIPGVIRKLGILAINWLNSKRINRYADAIVTYSRDTEIWGIPAISISNGINPDAICVSERTNDTSEIRAICVSSCVMWHGYDRFIEGIKDYYSNNENPQIKVYFDIVGEGPESGNYSALIKKYGLEEYISLHGSRKGEELNRLYQTADIAVDALGRHRVGVEYNSSLKGKEYAARGLPIVSGVSTEFDYVDGYQFYMRVPADDAPIDIGKVIDFYKNVKTVPDYHQKIRQYAEENFSYDVSYEPVIAFIKAHSISKDSDL